MEQQQKELEAKKEANKKAKEEAKERTKKVAGNGVKLALNLHFLK